MNQYKQKEAFCHLLHVQWRFDIRIVDYVPQAGERVFVDLTLEQARKFRTAYVEEWWEKPIPDYGNMKESGLYESKADAIEKLAVADWEQFGRQSPHVITGEEYRKANPNRYANPRVLI